MNPKILKSENFTEVQKALIKFYNERPDEYGMLERSQEVYEEYAGILSEFIEDRNSKIIDVGSGSWRIPDTIAKYGYKKVVGIDYFSEEKLFEYRKNIDNSNVELFSYSNNKIPFENNTFDVLTSLCVFEHIINVKEFLEEFDRVLKPGGLFFIFCPNWSGINVAITGMKHTLIKKDRFWRFENFKDAFLWFFRTIKWYFEVLLSENNKFIMIYPNMNGDEIFFERSDDDAVHLCQPLSFKKYFKRKGYKIIKYNRGFGTTVYSKIFNYIFPSLGTTNVIIAKK